MRKYITFLVLSLFLFPGIINALDCSRETINNYTKVLGNITYTYRYKEEKNKVTFDIILLNVPKDFYVHDDYHDKYSTSYGKDMTFSSFKPNDNYKFEIFPDINACPDIETKYIYVSLPGYNPYYKDPVCKGVSNYRLCNRWSNNTLKYKEFVSQVEAYKKRGIKKNPENKVVKTDTMGYIFDFYERYYMIILPFIIISIIGYIIYHNRRDDSLISVK